MKKGGKSDRNIPDCTGKEKFKKIPFEMEVAPPHKLVSFITHCFVANSSERPVDALAIKKMND